MSNLAFLRYCCLLVSKQAHLPSIYFSMGYFFLVCFSSKRALESLWFSSGLSIALTYFVWLLLPFLLEDIADFCIHTSQFVTLMWNAFLPSDLCTIFHYSDCIAVSWCCEFFLHCSPLLTQSTTLQQKFHTNFCKIPPSTKKR